MPRLFSLPGLIATVAAFALAGCTSQPEPAASGPGSPIAASRVGSSRPAGPPVSPPRDAYVLLTGGGTPLSNNYSHFLQAEAIAAFFARECPPDVTWIF